MVKWEDAPEGAEFYAAGTFWKSNSGYAEQHGWYCSGEEVWKLAQCRDYQVKPPPQEWPEDDTRINNIGLNRTSEDMGHYDELREAEQVIQPKTSADFLSACLQVQSERGKQYDLSGAGERSFAAAASAFNAVTGRDLNGSDVCLILEMVKLVRQYSSPDRLHADSVLDKVSYSSLWAEELVKELQK